MPLVLRGGGSGMVVDMSGEAWQCLVRDMGPKHRHIDGSASHYAHVDTRAVSLRWCRVGNPATALFDQ